MGLPKVSADSRPLPVPLLPLLFRSEGKVNRFYEAISVMFPTHAIHLMSAARFLQRHGSDNLMGKNFNQGSDHNSQFQLGAI